ncbi:MAG TPA: hypothetical protein VK588_01940 [Chitinophagaceae bacterium]|nr:hypothetical protein [Chitinophagaceae bacterium]
MPSNKFKRSEKEKFLDNYFMEQLQKIISRISNPELENRKDHLDSVYDSLMSIADEYQAVMVDEEEGYWDSIEMWHEEDNQLGALKWVNETINKEKEENI